MITARDAKKITETDITEELKIIEDKIGRAATQGEYRIKHRLPFTMKAEFKKKLLDTLKAYGYIVDVMEIYDPPSGWTVEDAAISWEQGGGLAIMLAGALAHSDKD